MGGKSTLLRQTCLAVIMAQSLFIGLISSRMLCSCDQSENDHMRPNIHQDWSK
jgi:hypothetical protein